IGSICFAAEDTGPTTSDSTLTTYHSPSEQSFETTTREQRSKTNKRMVAVAADRARSVRHHGRRWCLLVATDSGVPNRQEVFHPTSSHGQGDRHCRSARLPVAS